MSETPARSLPRLMSAWIKAKKIAFLVRDVIPLFEPLSWRHPRQIITCCLRDIRFCQKPEKIWLWATGVYLWIGFFENSRGIGTHVLILFWPMHIENTFINSWSLRFAPAMNTSCLGWLGWKNLAIKSSVESCTWIEEWADKGGIEDWK